MAVPPSLTEHALSVRRYDRERFVTALFAPPALRDDLLGIYAFNVEIARLRETVREAILGQIRLQWWRDCLEQIWRGDKIGHPVADALAPIIRRHALPRSLFDRLLEAREADLIEQPPASEADLLGYVEDSAAGLAELAARSLGADRAEALMVARQVGLAWGLTGLLRSHAYHIKLRRLMVPASVGLDPESLFAGESPPALAQWAESVAERAADALRTARAHRRHLPRTALAACLTARLADARLTALRRARFNLLDKNWSALDTRPLTLLVANGLGRF